MAATAPWDTYKADQINADLFQRVDEALAVLQESLRLLPGPTPRQKTRRNVHNRRRQTASLHAR
jgi:hypothetical protein